MSPCVFKYFSSSLYKCFCAYPFVGVCVFYFCLYMSVCDLYNLAAKVSEIDRDVPALFA